MSQRHEHLLELRRRGTILRRGGTERRPHHRHDQGLRASYTVTPGGYTSPTLSERFTYRGGQPVQTVVVSGTTA